MIIVGELINASRKKIGTAIENQDKDTIQQITVQQFEMVPITLTSTRAYLWAKKPYI